MYSEKSLKSVSLSHLSLKRVLLITEALLHASHSACLGFFL